MIPSTAHVVSVKPLENGAARWINLVQIEYRGVDGKLRTWEGTRRTTRPKNSAVDAVQILAVLEKPTGAEILLEKQYRPPVDKTVIELPAGLLDEGETPEECALRELREETGYIGEIVADASRPVLFSSPASSSSATYMIKVKIDGSKPENQNPAPQLEEGEFIETFWVPLKDLYAQCRKLEAEGFAIDGKVGSLAEGIEMSKMP